MGQNKRKGNKKRILTILCVFLLCIGFIMSSYSKPEESSVIITDSKELSYQNKESGSFRITKSAKWISQNQVKVTLDLDTVSFGEGNGKDIIFLLDVSENMKNEKLLGVKRELQNIINTVLLDSNNRIVLVTYSDTSKIISNLTNDRESLIQTLDGIEIETEGRNYYQAFKNVENILKELKPNNDRETSVILITGGYPNKETPNEVGEYGYLKEEYPDIPIYGIQYEIDGSLEQLKKVSDKVYSSTRETFRNHLHEVLGLTKEYEKLEITDFINHEQFNDITMNDITTTGGSITVEDNRVIWNLDGFSSGKSSKAEYILTRKESIEGNSYSVNERSQVQYKIGEVEEEIESTKTPVVERYFDITYEGNSPSGCTATNIPSMEVHEVFDSVSISEEIPYCEGYEFVGWKNVTEGVVIPNDREFLMPESDITFRAVWSKLSMSLSLNGEIYHYLEGTIRKVNHIDTEDLWKYKDSIQKIVFQGYLEEQENAVEVFDISSEQNGSIMAYLVPNVDETYTAYIQGDGKVTANPDSSYLFDRFTSLETIEGIENLDTSKVTNMSHMFGRCSSLRKIDLSHMDTSKVEDMSYMFHDCVSLTKVDLSELDLSNVKNMEGMFEGDINLKEVNFPPKGLPDVDNMKDMFKDCPNLETITPDDLNVKDDTDTDGIFEGGNNLEEPPIKKEYTVEIVGGNGGIVFPESLTIGFGKTNTIMVTPNTGYYLESFSCTNGYKNNAVIDISSSEHQIVKIDNNNENANSTCTATFGMAHYKIEYNLDGGTVEGENPTSYTIEDEDITLINPTKTGYSFTGWTSNDGGEQTKVVIPKGSTGSKSYTANWESKKYTVTVSSNTGGTISTTSLPIDYAGTNTFTVTPSNGYYLNSISCTNGYTTNATVGTNQTAAQTVTISNGGNEKDSTCTVTFTPITYTIGYTLNSGTVSGTNPTTYTVESNAITLINPTRTGYTFSGWSGSNGDAQTNVTIPKGSTGNKSYTANWQLKSYNVTISKNTGGTTSVSTLAVNYGSSNTLIISPTAGYYINSVSCTNGYTTNAKTGTDQTAIQTVTVSNNSKDSTSTCTVSFSPITYTIGYTLNGGTVSGTNPTTYTVESNAITLINPTRAGYTFTGWSGSNGSAQTSVTIPKGSTGNKSYTANWTAKSYTISLTRTDNGMISTSSLSVGLGGTTTFVATPNDGYYLKSVSCTNGYTTNAKTGAAQINAQTITVSNNSKDATSTCTITFDQATLVAYVTDLAKTDTTNLAYDGTVDNNLRYIGADPNNYVTFNGEKWRIIGVMNNITDSTGAKASHIKLIRADALSSIAWDTSKNNNWSQASLQKLLNSGDYWNRTNGLYSIYGLKDTTKAQISNVVWNLGGHNTFNATASTFYTAERGTSVYSGRPTTWTGYVGLMYLSDYGYAVGGSVRNTCLGKYLAKYYEGDCHTNDWVTANPHQWTITPRSDSSSAVCGLYGTGNMTVLSVENSNNGGRPSVYLNSDIRKTGGSGSSTDPFTIG